MDTHDEFIEYLISIVPAAKVDCAGCGREREANVAVFRDGQFYHSEECADRALALYRKPQPEGVKAGGYMDV